MVTWEFQKYSVQPSHQPKPSTSLRFFQNTKTVPTLSDNQDNIHYIAISILYCKDNTNTLVLLNIIQAKLGNIILD